jgi:hypothetical protein
MDNKQTSGFGVGMGTIVFIVLIVVALVQGAPLWGTSWGWFILQSVLIWLGISIAIPLLVLGVLFLFVIIVAALDR